MVTRLSRMIRTVRVEDNTPPRVTLIGPSTVKLELGQAYKEKDVKVVDSLDGDVSEEVY